MMRTLRSLSLALSLTACWITDSKVDASDSIYAWSFDQSHRDAKGFRPIAGNLHARTKGSIEPLGKEKSPGAVFLDGKTSRIVASDKIETLPLPTETVHVEAVVSVFEPLRWGGIVTAFQDNGNFERGFLLGFENDRFSFAVSTEGTNKLTYVTAKSAFTLKRWYHVAGTYDGKVARLRVNGEIVAESDAPAGKILPAPRGFLEIGAYHDDDEDFRTPMAIRRASISHAPPKELSGADALTTELAALPPLEEVDRERFGPFSRVLGPFVEFVDRDRVKIDWETDVAVQTEIELEINDTESLGYDETTDQHVHSAEFEDIAPERVYKYRLHGTSEDGKTSILSPEFEFDSSFNYTPPPIKIEPWPGAKSSRDALYEKLADRIVAHAGIAKGYCLILDSGDGRLAYELAKRTEWKIVGLEQDEQRLDRTRRTLDAAGIYGTRVSVHRWDGDALPYGPYLANVITTDAGLTTGGLPKNVAEIYRVLRPSGGLLALGSWDDSTQPIADDAFPRWLQSAGKTNGDSKIDEGDPRLWFFTRGKLPGGGEWTHQYASPDNSSCSQDELVSGKLQVAWFGRPGPRPMPDRGPRNPAPVSANGRLYVQGYRVLFALDAYNGTILWCKQIPTMRRANMPRASSNMVATDDALFVAVGEHIIGFDGQTGKRIFARKAKRKSENREYEWGYLASTAAKNGAIIGSSTIRGGNYLGDDGEWFEDEKDNSIAKVTSDSVYSINPETGEELWSYANGVVVNSTITISDGVVYFIESRNPDAKNKEKGRLSAELEKDQHIVALNVDSGSKLWEMPFDASKCQFTTYFSHSKDTLFVCGTDKKKTFHTWAIDTKDQKVLWEHHIAAKKTHHSGHLMHPVIVDDKIFVNKHTFDLRSGDILKFDPFDYHGCGTMAASSGAIFHRFEYHGMLDLATNKRTEFVGVRGGCWLGQIPAGGMLLAPESGAGCSCTHAFQTSMGFVPVVEIEEEEKDDAAED